VVEPAQGDLHSYRKNTERTHKLGESRKSERILRYHNDFSRDCNCRRERGSVNRKDPKRQSVGKKLNMTKRHLTGERENYMGCGIRESGEHYKSSRPIKTGKVTEVYEQDGIAGA